MTRPLSRRARPAALVCLLVLAVSCAAEAPPAYMAPQGTGATGRTGSIVVTNAAIAFAGGPADPVVYRVGGSADIVGTVVNVGDRADRLVAVRSPVAGDATVDGNATVAPGAELALGPQPGAALPGVAPVRVRLTQLRADVRSGLTYPVDLVFAGAGTLRLPLPVALPDTSRTACPLPPDGKVPEVLTAPSGAPVPSTTPPPTCSSLQG